MGSRYQNGWWLSQKYHKEGLTQREIAEMCDVSPRTIRKYMNRYSIETREMSGKYHPLYGTERDETTKKAISNSLLGRDLDDQWRENIAHGLQGREIPESVRRRISESLSGRSKSLKTRRRMSESTAGSNNPNWKGGYSRYYGSGWSTVRERVRKRDEVCRKCGHDGSSNRLEVHHIIPVRRFRNAELSSVSDAHEMSNLVLLCNSCHTKADFGVIEFDSGLDDPILTDE